MTKNSMVNHSHKYSLLPDDEDYMRSIAMVSIPSVLKRALELDTPQSRAIITGGLAVLGALVGHAVTEKPVGAGIGPGIGLVVSLFVCKHFNPLKDSKAPESDIRAVENPMKRKYLNQTYFCSN